jgi:hypothetical protein
MSQATELIGQQMAVAAGAPNLLKTNQVNVKTFNAKGDGVTDDTAAIRAALAYAQTVGRNLYFPIGTYLTDTINYGFVSSAGQISIIGEDVATTIIKKKSADGLALFTIGVPDTGGYMGGWTIKNISFVGIPNDTSAALRIYNMIRSSIVRCRFNSAVIGLDLLGGVIANNMHECTYDQNQVGLNVDRWNFTAGYNFPNLNSAFSCLFLDNSVMGVRFDGGRLFNLTDCEIEGNGFDTTKQTANPHGGLWVGANIGISDGLLSPGINLSNTWVEANSGGAAISLHSGRNNLTDVYCIANGAVYDIYVAGGKYHLEGVDCDSPKTYNIYEEPAILSGNFIIDCDYANSNYDKFKTMSIEGANSNFHGIKMRNGQVPVSMGINLPNEQYGSDFTASGVVTVTFPQVFFAPPTSIQITMINNSDLTVESCELYSVSNTGFTVRKKKLTSGSNVVGLSTAGFYWRAIGELWHP